MEDIGKIAAYIIGGLVVVYVAFQLIKSFIDITPDFGNTGWYIFGVIVAAFVGGIYLVFKGKS
jgi:hypothetical protein